jgi:hypothetical protein
VAEDLPSRRSLSRRRAALLGATLLGAAGSAAGASRIGARPAPPAPGPRIAAAQQDQDGASLEPSWARPGPYRGPDPTPFDPVRRESFGPAQRVALTYFFYWYDAAYFRGTRGRTNAYPFNPVNHETMSFLDPAWYVKEFVDMQDAGLDAALPVYWGEPGQYPRRVAPAPELNLFATQGLPPMVEALETLRAGGRPFKVGLFFDTSILNDADLTTPEGKAVFYATIRDYYSRIPPHHWAAIEGRPIVWLYDAQRVKAFDQGVFDEVYARFPRDFGGLLPYVVRENQWYRGRVAPPQPVLRTEGLYIWGAAPFGFNDDPVFTVAEVGPGFCNSQFGGSGANRFCVDRADGRYYLDQLEAARRSGRRILAVETWNELGEASGILETEEWGRLYLDLTRQFLDGWRRG